MPVQTLHTTTAMTYHCAMKAHRTCFYKVRKLVGTSKKRPPLKTMSIVQTLLLRKAISGNQVKENISEIVRELVPVWITFLRQCVIRGMHKIAAIRLTMQSHFVADIRA